MFARPTHEPEPAGDALGLDAFRQVSAEPGPTLDQLSAALGKLIGAGDDPYAAPAAEQPAEAAPRQPDVDAACEITPRSILEAMLFVDSPRNEPLTSKQVASLMRGVRPAEIDALVRELNESYAMRNCPYTIMAQGAGYRLVLTPHYERLRDKLYGRTRRARLSHAAIEVLAIVAYNGPLTSDEISRMRGTPSGHLLTQLVRRQLLRLDRPDDKPRRNLYTTTPRFLALFGLENLAELPRNLDLDASPGAAGPATPQDG